MPLGSRVALATDLYELTMASSYVALGLRGPAVFSSIVRELPPNRAFLVAAGIEEAVRRLLALRFDDDAIAFVRSTGRVSDAALDVLATTRFTGDVWAVREGTFVFAGEPLLEVRAPILEAQLVESIVLNALHYATAVATKASRCVAAARGKDVVDFGLRRTPSIDAGLDAARACFLAGFASTSNVLAGAVLGVPVSGTVAHSFIELCATETEAFRAVARTALGPITLLVDTYDTPQGIAHAIDVARELGAGGRAIAAVRLDSGDLDLFSRRARAMLDAAGFGAVRIVASGGLDEHAIARLARAGAPIDGFGVGTQVGTSADAPALDMAYKIVEYAGRPCLKLSQGKSTLVGPKQIWRRRDVRGRFVEDVIAARDEPAPGREWAPLLAPIVTGGVARALPSLAELRREHAADRAALPDDVAAIDARAAYPVRVSATLAGRQRDAVAATRAREGLA